MSSGNARGFGVTSDTLTITDNRTGPTYEVPIEDGAIRATACARSRSTTTTSAS